MIFQISYLRFLFVFVIVSALYFLLDKFAFQWAPEPLEPSADTFSSIRGYKHWQQLSVSVPTRHVSTQYYNISYNYILSAINSYKKLSTQNKNNLSITIEEQSDPVYETKMGHIMQVQKDVRNIMVTISEKKGSERNPILISAHIDGKNTGPGAYDDAIGIAAMLELMNVICEPRSKPLKNSLILLFIGVEEQGLQGSKLFLKYFKKNISSFLNIESVGPGLPFGIMQKGNGSTAIINSLTKKSKGILFGTIADDVTKLGIISSTSDTVRFRENGLQGAELLFFGNPTKYHTSLDKIGAISHLQMLGNSLTDILYNFEPTDAKDDSAAIGISPFVLVVNLKKTKIIGRTIIMCALGAILVSKVTWRSLIITLFIQIICWIFVFAIFLALGYLSFLVNSLCVATNVMISFVSLGFCGFLLFSFFFTFFESFTPHSTPISAQFALVLFDSLLVVLTNGYDSSIIFIWRLAFSTVGSFFMIFEHGHILAYFFNIIGFVSAGFASYLLYFFMTQYSSLIPGFVGDLIPFAISSLFILFFVSSFLPFILSILSSNHSKPLKKRLRKQDMIFFFISLALLSVLFALPPPYSANYNIQGELSHIIDPINGSYVAFSPDAGKRSFRGVMKYVKMASGIKTAHNFNKPLMFQDVIYRNASSKLPNFIQKWPKYELNITKNGTDSGNFQRKVRFVVPNINPDLMMITLILNCSNVSCLESVDGYEKVQNLERKDKFGFRYALRYMPGFLPGEICFTVSGLDKIPMKITFTWDEWTEETRAFLKDLPHFIQPIGKLRSIDDTTLINYTII